MMMWLRNPKNVKTITIAIAAIFILGVAFTGVSSFGNQASAAPASSVAVVDMQQVFMQSTDYRTAEEAFQKEQVQAQEDFKTKTAGMTTDAEKQEYGEQLGQRLRQKQEEILGAWEKKLDSALKKAADSKGYSVVMDKARVLYGGTDITAEVIKQLNGK